MILPKNLRKRYQKVKQRGTLTALKQATGIQDLTAMHHIMSGKYPTTLAKIAKIKVFIEKYEKQIAQLTDDNN